MWLGIAKVGATAALINYNLKLEPLAHSIRSSKAKAVVFNPEFADGKNLSFLHRFWLFWLCFVEYSGVVVLSDDKESIDF